MGEKFVFKQIDMLMLKFSLFVANIQSQLVSNCILYC